MVDKISVFAESCTGASHIQIGKECQDFSVCIKTEKTAIIAVADGHGSDEYFRSARGACFATTETIKRINNFLKIHDDVLCETEQITDIELKTLEKSIVDGWREAITEDLKREPVENGTVTAYGTTLLAAAMTERYWFALQIGDGKCVIINEDNSVLQPVPWDDRCFLNRTTSLCDENACALFRHYYSETLPLAVFLGSDGIDDSFPINGNDEYLANFYTSVYRNFLDEGLQKGKIQLRDMLPKLTQKGSGDDVSIAGMIRGIKN
ncbi:hypothetical protein R84B8_02504 [Treponema sp. R8-4-B8]